MTLKATISDAAYLRCAAKACRRTGRALKSRHRPDDLASDRHVAAVLIYEATGSQLRAGRILDRTRWAIANSWRCVTALCEVDAEFERLVASREAVFLELVERERNGKGARDVG